MVLAGLAAGIVLALPGASASRAPEDCRTRGTTLEANAHARLFSTFSRRTRARRYYACRVADRRAVYVGRNDPFEEGVAATIDLAGFHVLFEEVGCDRDVGCRASDVRLMDIRVPLEMRTVAWFEEPKASAATDLLLTRDRTAAWIRPVAGGAQVARARPGEDVVVLASGAGVEPGSLATAGRRLYWTDEGRAESAPTR